MSAEVIVRNINVETLFGTYLLVHLSPSSLILDGCDFSKHVIHVIMSMEEVIKRRLSHTSLTAPPYDQFYLADRCDNRSRGFPSIVLLADNGGTMISNF